MSKLEEKISTIVRRDAARSLRTRIQTFHGTRIMDLLPPEVTAKIREMYPSTRKK